MAMALAELSTYPGNPRHQALLRAIAAYYAGDPRILAVAVFGLLGRGNWHADSDLDLDVVVVEGVTIEVVPELERLCASFAPLGERAALIIPTGADAADVVLASLLEISIRYHPLADTSPNIVDSLSVLAGPLDVAKIKAAGEANRQPQRKPLALLLDKCLCYGLEVDIAIRRGLPWSAVELLQRMRGLLMEMYGRARGGLRPAFVFEREADADLQARFGATLPQYDPTSLRAALEQSFAILEHDLDTISTGQLRLGDNHRAIIAQLRGRLAG
jgi:predicted nucleotidyltransferase